jgi:SAM-dependent methyltransferase
MSYGFRSFATKVAKRLFRTILLVNNWPFSRSVHTPRNWNFTRYAMYSALHNIFQDRNSPDAAVLSISASDRMVAALGLVDAMVTNADYPTHDLRKLPFEDGSYDFVIADQVIEHIDGNLESAFAEALRVLRPGGKFVCATCTMMPLHHLPHDYWRFTPMGLRHLGAHFRTIDHEGSWGNAFMPLVVLAGLHYQPIPPRRCLLGTLAQYNDPQWPSVVWAVFGK